MVKVQQQCCVQYTTGCVKRVGIIGVPFDRGQQINTEFHEGPKAIRDGGLIDELTEFNGKCEINTNIRKTIWRVKFWIFLFKNGLTLWIMATSSSEPNRTSNIRPT